MSTTTATGVQHFTCSFRTTLPVVELSAVTHARRLAPALLARLRATWKTGAGAAATGAGTVVNVLNGRRPRAIYRMIPGIAGAALAATGIGELAGHVFGRGLAPWVACTVAAWFLLQIGRELNTPPVPVSSEE